MHTQKTDQTNLESTKLMASAVVTTTDQQGATTVPEHPRATMQFQNTSKNAIKNSLLS